MRREFSAGGIVFKREGRRTFWLVRKPRGNENYKGNLGWSLPKGWIDKGEKIVEAALREVREEGGVQAKPVKKLGTMKIFFTDKDGNRVMKFITFFVMEYVADAPEGVGWETAEVTWVLADEAMKMLVYKGERELLRKAEDVLIS